MCNPIRVFSKNSLSVLKATRVEERERSWEVLGSGLQVEQRSPRAGQDLSYTAEGASRSEGEVGSLFPSKDLSKLISQNLALSAGPFWAPQP